jgi:LPS-assembly protein
MRRPFNHCNPLAALLALALWVAAGITGALALTSAARAQDPAAAPDPSNAWQIKADRIDYDQNLDEYLATGAVHITKEGRTLTADSVRVNQTTGDALADGHVHLTSKSDVLSGNRLKLNLNDETGILTDGTVFIAENHLYLKGHEIRKTGLSTYTADAISVTACDGPDPDWELTGRDFKVTIEGYGQAWHTALWAGKIPVLYSPYLLFPVKLKRQSGLLTPEFGFSSRKGAEYLQPFYWAIDQSSDATFYADYMSDRGLRNGIEYRYVLADRSYGALFFDGFQDFKIDDGLQDDTRRYGYADDKALRENKDRYWFRMKHDQELGWGLSAKLDLDVVSDQDYLHEFKSGYDGFDETRDYFEKTFGRDIDDYNDPIRLNRLNLNRLWNHYSFNTDLRWYDDVIKRRTGGADNTLQQLPTISLDGVKQPIGQSPLYFDLTTSYSYFYRIDGTRGQRADVYPRVYYPFELFQAFSVEPSAGIRQTAWHVDHYETQPDHERNDLYRALYDFKLDISTELYRLFDFSLGGSDRLKHTIIPEVTYEFIPDEDQGDFPVFDSLDRIERKNLITYGFTNYFTARKSKPAGGHGGQFNYNPFLRFKLTQSFDIDKRNEGDPEPFSDIMAELDLTPGRFVSINSDASWSMYDNEFKSLNTALKLWNQRGDQVSADYRYTRQDPDTAVLGVRTLRLDGELHLSDKWRLRGGYENNLYNQIEIERSLGIGYQSSCWGVTVDFAIEQGNQRYSCMFNLAGLGDAVK